MFLVRLLYLKGFKKKDHKDTMITKDVLQSNNKIIEQIKNTSQQNEIKPKIKSQETTSKLFINSFEELIKLCIKKKEIKLKYELESNVNLVTFDQGRIEIAFNENLDKDFIKDLSSKLYEWSGTRWIISLSKKKGLISKKQEEKINKDKIIDSAKKTKIYSKVLEILPDAQLVEFKMNENKNE